MHDGGAQFAIVFREAYLENVLRAVEQACADFAELAIAHAGSPTGHLTISAGVATCPGDAGDIEGLFATADRALHRAGERGGNRIAGRTYAPRAPRFTASLPMMNVPAPLTQFFGRERELGDLAERLRAARLVTIAGPGGVGKTRLAIESARRARRDFSEGIWFVDLTAVGDLPGIVTAVAACFGIKEIRGRSLGSVLTAELRARQTLIVLDNCEHMIDACAEFVTPFLREAPSVTFLVTSREPLAIIGDSILRIDPLQLPPSDDVTAAEALRYAAVALFVERAQGVTRFELDDTNAALAVHVCRRLDGLPLAIELAAVTLRATGLAELSQSMDRRLELQTGSRRGGRHDSMRAVLEWSIATLREPENVVFRRLSVFAGGWTLPVAHALCADVEENTLSALTRLLDASIISLEPRGDHVRYRMLETTRDYARELLIASGEMSAVRRRHAQAVLAFAEETERRFKRMPTRAWIEWICADEANVWAALEWAVGEEHDLDIGASLCAAWYTVADHTGRPAELRRWMQRINDAKPRLKPLTDARLALVNGMDAIRLGDAQRAIPYEEHALELFGRLENADGYAVAMRGLGSTLVDAGELERAHALLTESLERFRALDDTYSIAVVTYELGRVLWLRGRQSEAVLLFEEAAGGARASGHDRLLAVCMAGLAVFAYDKGNYLRAVASSSEALRLYERLGNSDLFAFESNNLGEYLRRTGQHEAARAAFSRALKRFVILDSPRAKATSLEGLARIALDEGDAARAVRIVAFSDTNITGAFARQPLVQALHDSTLQRAKDELGDERFAREYSTGTAYCLDEAIGLALGEGSPSVV